MNEEHVREYIEEAKQKVNNLLLKYFPVEWKYEFTTFSYSKVV